VGQLGKKVGVLMPNLVVPDELAGHAPEIKRPAGISAICVAVAGIVGALIVYVWEWVSVHTLRRSLNVLYHATWNKWWFDELYDFIFVRPTLAIGRFIAYMLDRGLIDGFINSLAWVYRGGAAVVAVVGDRWIIDNFVDTVAEKTWDLGLSMRAVQTGRLRHYVMFIVVGTVVLFIFASLWWKYAVAGP
jgi:NADH:ubiquinone oxidoreductase subunit 5 (subunit L)/multisubunit Na+/H+ antiporter MnhA subunit